MLRSEHTLSWNGPVTPASRPASSLDVPISRRRLLVLAGAAAAGLALAGPGAPALSLGGSTLAVESVALPNLDAGQFIGLLGETFQARVLAGEAAGNPATFTLTDVSIPNRDDGDNRPDGLRTQPFNLLFLLQDGTPGGSGIVRLEHNQLGSVELFVHQVLSTRDMPVYEAVLN